MMTTTLLMGGSANRVLPQLNPKGVAFKRGKIKVDAIVLFSQFFDNDKIFDNYRRIYDEYWGLFVNLKLLKVQMRQYRRLFGVDCFETGQLNFTKHFWYEAYSYLLFGRPFAKLKEVKRSFVMNYWNPEIAGLMQSWHHPMLQIMKDHFTLVRSWSMEVKKSGGVIGYTFAGSAEHNPLLKRFPSFNTELMGVRPLTDVQLAKLANRKRRLKAANLWNLIYDTRAIKKQLSLANDIRICLNMSLQGLVVYSPVYQMIDRSDQDKPPLVKFKAPAFVKTLPGINPFDKMWSDPSMFPEQLIGINNLIQNKAGTYHPYKVTKPVPGIFMSAYGR